MWSDCFVVVKWSWFLVIKLISRLCCFCLCMSRFSLKTKEFVYLWSKFWTLFVIFTCLVQFVSQRCISMHCTLPLKFLNHSLNENSSVGNGLINLKKLKITDMQVADQLQGPPKAFQPLHNLETTFKNASNLPC